MWLLFSGALRKGWSTQECMSSSAFLGQISVKMSGCKAPFPHWKQTITPYLKSREIILGVWKLPFSPVSTSGLCDRGSQQRANCSLGRWPKSCFVQRCCRPLKGFVCCLPSPPLSSPLSAPGCPSSQVGAVQLVQSLQGWREVSPREKQPPEALVTGLVSHTTDPHLHGCTSTHDSWRAQLYPFQLPHSAVQGLPLAHVQQEHLWPNTAQESQRSGKNNKAVRPWAAQSSGEKMEQECFRKGG